MERHDLDRSELARTGDWNDYLRWREAFHGILDPAYYPPEWLDEQVYAHAMHLIVGRDAAILVSLKQYPSGLWEVQGEGAVGKLGAIVSDLIPLVERMAKAAGCSSALIQSRPGWKRIMKHHGYSLHQTTIRKDL